MLSEGTPAPSKAEFKSQMIPRHWLVTPDDLLVLVQMLVQIQVKRAVIQNSKALTTEILGMPRRFQPAIPIVGTNESFAWCLCG